jgi:hypothetical protein
MTSKHHTQYIGIVFDVTLSAFWGNSTDSKKIFTVQKKIIRKIADVKKNLVYGIILKNLIYFPSPVNTYSHYCLSLLITCKNLK